MAIRLAQKDRFSFTDENDKEVYGFDIVFKDPNKKELKKLNILHDKKKIDIEALFKSNGNAYNALRQAQTLEAKLDGLKSMENKGADIVDTANKLEKLYKKYDKYSDEFEANGGADMLEKISKAVFDKFVKCEKKEEFAGLIEEHINYTDAIEEIRKGIAKNKGN